MAFKHILKVMGLATRGYNDKNILDTGLGFVCIASPMATQRIITVSKYVYLMANFLSLLSRDKGDTLFFFFKYS